MVTMVCAGFQPQQTEQTLRTILQTLQEAANAQPLLMQIRQPAYHRPRRYNEAFSAIYPKLAKEFDIPLLPFFMEEVYLKPQWMQVMMAFTPIAMPSRSLPTGWQPGWLFSKT